MIGSNVASWTGVWFGFLFLTCSLGPKLKGEPQHRIASRRCERSDPKSRVKPRNVAPEEARSYAG